MRGKQVWHKKKKNPKTLTSLWFNGFRTSLIRVTQYGFLLGPQARTGPVFHPRRHGELVRQVLGHHVTRDVGRLTPGEPVDEVAVSAAVAEEGRRPVGWRAGCGEEVGAARRRACSVSETQQWRRSLEIAVSLPAWHALNNPCLSSRAVLSMF